MVEVPFPVPAFSVHTKSVEHAVKQVIEAAATVVGFESREGFITARMEHRLAMSKSTKKHGILPLFKNKFYIPQIV